MKLVLAAALATAVLSGCTETGTVSIPLGGGIILEEAMTGFQTARNSSPFAAPVPLTPTTGTATYTGGALFDMTQNGGDGDMIFMGLNMTAAFGATAAQVSGSMENAVRVGMSAATYDSLNDALTATGQTVDSAVAAATDLADQVTSTEALSGSVQIASQSVTNADPQWTTQINGTLTGDSSTVEVDTTAAALFSEASGAGIRITGTNFGNVEIGVNGTPTTAYLNGYAIRQ